MAIIWTTDDTGTMTGTGDSGATWTIGAAKGGMRRVSMGSSPDGARCRGMEAAQAHAEREDIVHATYLASMTPALPVEAPAPIVNADAIPPVALPEAAPSLPCDVIPIIAPNTEPENAMTSLPTVNADPIPPVDVSVPCVSPLSGATVDVIHGSGGAPAFVANVPDAKRVPVPFLPIGADSGSNASADRATPLPIGNGAHSLMGGAPSDGPNGHGASIIGSAGRYAALRANAAERERRADASAARMVRYTVNGYFAPTVLPSANAVPFAVAVYLADFAHLWGAIDDDGAAAIEAGIKAGSDMLPALKGAVRAYFNTMADDMADDGQFMREAKRVIRDYCERVCHKGFADGEGGRVMSLRTSEREGAAELADERTRLTSALIRVIARADDGTPVHVNGMTEADALALREKTATLNARAMVKAERVAVEAYSALRELLEHLALPVRVSKRGIARAVKDAKRDALAEARVPFDALMVENKAKVAEALAYADAKDASDKARLAIGELATTINKDRASAAALARLAGTTTDAGRKALYARASEAYTTMAQAQTEWRDRTRVAVGSAAVDTLAGRTMIAAPRSR